ncbi:MAG: response regulator [Parvibaculaceae bacterium]|nr:response regulator [Parvibaculaceae bacterium]
MPHKHLSHGLNLSSLRVLLVDDDAALRGAVAAILRALGAREVVEAPNGKVALEVISANPPDFIISDWEMAPMNGAELLSQVRRESNKPSCFIPIVILTAHARPTLIRHAVSLGASQLLVKPVSPERLLSQIRWVLADSRQFYLQDGAYRLPMPGQETSTDKNEGDIVWV